MQTLEKHTGAPAQRIGGDCNYFTCKLMWDYCFISRVAIDNTKQADNPLGRPPKKDA